MGFCRTNLFKRLESGGYAFLQSLDRHILRNYIFLHAMANNLPLPIGSQDPALLDTRYLVDILAAVKRTAIPKPHDLGFCFFPLRGSAPALTDLLCSGLMVALQTDTASPAAKIFLLALISRSW